MRHIKFLFAVVYSVSLTASYVSAQTVVPSKSTPSETTIASATDNSDRYRIGFRDVITVQIDRHADLNQTVPINPNGTISLFRIDRPIVAVCKTERELATDIRDAYMEKNLRNPLVRVLVSEQRSQQISVNGAVVNPNSFYITRRVHLLEALAMAGGPNKDAGTRLIVARGGSSSNCKEAGETPDTDQIAVFNFKIRDVLEGKQTFWMKPGDFVSVQDADIVYVYGNVNRQGSYSLREPITLMQALVKAEGLKGAAKKDKIRILRQRDGVADREELFFDLNQIEKGKAKDPFLEPNDILAVSEDKTKSILQGIVNSIKGAAPNVIYRIPLP